ncbi:MAG: SPOR domain-containing protein [Betaproteobacteria bacterium]
MRTRARNRLIGAATLVLIGVVGFPLLFDSQPRPIDVNIAIDIPDKAKVAPLSAASAAGPAKAETAAASAAAVSAPLEQEVIVAPATKPAAAAPAATAAAVLAPAAIAALSPPAATAPAPAKAASNATAQPQPNPTPTQTKAAEAAKAQTLLDGKAPAASASSAQVRYTVQVGAFADVQKAREARQTLEKAGLKTYTQVVNGADGRRIRVRVGPWTDKAEADKAAAKIKSLNLPAQLLTL